MSSTLRRALVAGALSTVIAAGGGTSTATAVAPVPTADCATATAQVTAAKADAVAARKAFVASNRPMGKLLAVERTQARTEARTSRSALRALHRQVTTTDDAAARKILLVQIKAERADVRHSMRLLSSKTALRAQVKAERKTAKKAFTLAKAALATARTAADQACGEATPEPPETTE